MYVENGRVYVGGYNFEYYEFIGDGSTKLKLIANSVDMAFEQFRNDRGLFHYLTDDELNLLYLKVAERILKDYSIDKAKRYFQERLEYLKAIGWMTREAVEQRLSVFDENELSFGLRLWAENLIRRFDEDHRNTIKNDLAGL